MSNFTLTDSQIATLRAAKDLITSVSEELDVRHIITIQAQKDAGRDVVVSTFEGDPSSPECVDAEIETDDFTIQLRHFHDGRSQYITLPEDAEVEG